MEVLVVGSGGREHAICWALSKSPKVTELYCAPGNGGIGEIAQCVDVKATDIPGMVAWATEHKIDFVMVAPDDPLCHGHGGRTGGGGHPRLRSPEECRDYRGQQGVLQGAHEEIRHSHGGLCGVYR